MAGEGGFNTGMAVIVGDKEMGVSDLFPYFADLSRNTTLIVGQSGACSPDMGDVKERLSVFRHQEGVFRGTIAAAAADITIAPANVVLFGTGVTDSGEASGFGAGALTRAETNTQTNGGLVQQGQNFITLGFFVRTAKPYFVASSAPATVSLLDNRHYPKWLRDKNTEYDEAGLEALMDAAAASAWKAGPTAACEYDLGPLSLSLLNAQGSTEIAGQFWFLAVPAATGGTQSGKQLALTVRNERTLIIDNDTGNNTPAQGCVAYPFRAVHVGFPVCATDGGPKLVITAESIQEMKKLGMSDEQIRNVIMSGANRASLLKG